MTAGLGGWLVAAGVAGWLGMAGCGGGDGQKAPQGPPINACALLAPNDVATVTREVAGSLSSTLEDAVGHDPTLCTYALAGEPPKAISLSVKRLASAEAARDQNEATESGMRSLGPSAPVADVAGLGDKAFWVGGQIDQMHIQRGDLLLILTAQLDEEPLQAARALAGRVLQHLAHPAAPGRPAAAVPPAPGAAATQPPAAAAPAPTQPPAATPPPAHPKE